MSDVAFDSTLPRGEESTAFGKYFTGQDYLNMLNTKGVMVADVIFKPDCRSSQHIHHISEGGGQILLYTVKSGWSQAEGEAPVNLEPNSVVTIPANRRYWHGTRKDSWFSHITVEAPNEDTNNEWCESVSDECCENL